MRGAGLFVLLCFHVWICAHAVKSGSLSLHHEDSGLSTNRSSGSEMMMIISGMTSRDELCLAVGGGQLGVEGAPVELMPCVAAIAAGDGRELFAFQAKGQIMTSVAGFCLGLQENTTAEGGNVVVVRCDDAAVDGQGRSVFEMNGNGQIMVGNTRGYCLSQSGTAGGIFNAAAQAAITASSTADSAAHGASKAVDGRLNTYWASEPTTSHDPVDFIIDFGEALPLHRCEIVWEYPAKAFTISLSSDGTNWVDVFSTDSNSLRVTRFPLGLGASAKAKVVMREPHPIYGDLKGHGIYGIVSLSFAGGRTHTIAETCANAGSRDDSRDKFFLSNVGEVDTHDLQILREELAVLSASKVSLASVAVELSEVLPLTTNCALQGSPRPPLPQMVPVLVSHGNQHRQALFSKRKENRFAGHAASMYDDSMCQGSELEQVCEAVDEQLCLDFESLELLRVEVRGAILQIRTDMQ